MKSMADQQSKVVRQPITRGALEREIAEAVKAGGTDCEEFVGVIVERLAPVPPGGANWAVKGVKYGKSNRELCAAALIACMAEKQLKFEVSD